MSADTQTKMANTQTERRIPMCRDALHCPIYAQCRRLNNANKPLPADVEAHMKRFKHIAVPICRFHEKSREKSGCKHIHMGDLDDVKDETGKVITRGIKGNLCYYDMKCNNPRCRYYHGWKCPYGIRCNNKDCPLIHPMLKDVEGKEIVDGRKHMLEPSFFGNYPKPKEDKKPIEKVENKKEEKVEDKKPEEKPTGRRGRRIAGK